MVEPPCMKARFADLSSQLVAQVVEDGIPEATKKATSFRVNVLQDFILEKRFDIDLERCDAKQFDEVLCHCYVSLRTRDGAVYKKSSYLATSCYWSVRNERT